MRKIGRRGERARTDGAVEHTRPLRATGERRMLRSMYYTLAQRWALAMAGVIHEINGRDARFPGGAPASEDGRASAAHILSHWWEIETREALEETLTWLRDTGTRAQYAAIAAGGDTDD